MTEQNIYHIYNRTNNHEPLFLSAENRRFFLRKYSDYLSPFLDTYCWCLLPDHFHFLVRIKTAAEIKNYLTHLEILNSTEKDYLNKEQPCSKILKNAFHRLFTSYAMSFNRYFQRKGNLFHRPFKRLEVKSRSHFTQAVVYIHANPTKHKVVDDFMNYEWSSWPLIMSAGPTGLLRQELIDWFGGPDMLIKAHNDLSLYYHDSEIAIEC